MNYYNPNRLDAIKYLTEIFVAAHHNALVKYNNPKDDQFRCIEKLSRLAKSCDRSFERRKVIANKHYIGLSTLGIKND